MPMIDVFVEMPGAGARRSRSASASRWRRSCGRSPGSSTSTPSASPGAALAIVRFYVGEDEERSIVKLHDKLCANFDLIPPGARSRSSSRARSTTCRSSPSRSGASAWIRYMLRRIAAAARRPGQGRCRTSSETTAHRRRAAPAARDARPRPPGRLRRDRRGAVLAALGEANRALRVGQLRRAATASSWSDAGASVATAEDVGRWWSASRGGRPVYLRRRGPVDDGPEEPREYVLMSGGAAGRDRRPGRPCRR